jgi:hypothetical protein
MIKQPIHRCGWPACGKPQRGESAAKLAYMRITGNNWNQADSESYEQNAIGKIPVEKVVSVMENVARRTAAKINSFRYFVKLATPDLAAVPGRRSNSSELPAEFGRMRSVERTMLQSISLKMSNALVLAKVFGSTTICSIS